MQGSGDYRPPYEPSTEGCRTVLGFLAMIAVTVVWLLLAWSNWRDYRDLGSWPATQPIAALPLRAGANPVWVDLRDGSLHCEHVDYSSVRSSQSTRVVVTDASRQVVVMVALSGHLNCEELRTASLVGVLSPMSQTHYAEYAPRNMLDLASYDNPATFWELDTRRGGHQSLDNAICFAALAPVCFGLALYLLFNKH